MSDYLKYKTVFRKILIGNIILALITANLNAQNSGYGGKRFLIKADILEGRKSILTGVDVETVPFRNITMTLGFKYFSSQVNQKFSVLEYEGHYYNFRDDFPLKMPDKASVVTRSINFEIRQYMNKESFLNAPFGYFRYLSATYGLIDVNGNYYENLIDLSLWEDNGAYISYSYKNLNFFSVEYGIGYQAFLAHWFSIGCNGGLGYTRILNELEFVPAKAVSGVAKRYGYNLIGVHPTIKSKDNYDYEDIGVPAKSSVGLSFYIQCGIMLF